VSRVGGQVPQRSSTGNRERDGRFSLSAVSNPFQRRKAQWNALAAMRATIVELTLPEHGATAMDLGFAAGLAQCAALPAVQQPGPSTPENIQVDFWFNLRNINTV